VAHHSSAALSRPPLDDRKALEGIVFVLRSGIPWAMLPQRMGCGSGMTCWRRLRDWQAAGVRFAGIRTSRRRVLRLMRENRLLAHQRAGRPHGSRTHDGTITTERVDVMWGTDLTSVMTGEGQAAVLIAVDHCSTECVGIHASRSADRFQALEPVKQAVRQCHGGFAKGIAAGLRLRHDHGSQYVSHDFQAEIRFLGIESSPAFVREPEGNGCAERFIRVLKENLLWVRRFDTVEELRLALLAFRQTYNQSWIIERHGYKTPARVRADQIGQIPMAA
jgi:transposase InsO family protein